MDDLITRYSEIDTRFLEWIWFPYIARGKLTIIQGNDKNNTFEFITRLISYLSQGKSYFDKFNCNRSYRILYLTTNDCGYAKSKFEECGADCNNIAFVDNVICEPFLIDTDEIVRSIEEYRAHICVIDPLAAYLDLKCYRKKTELPRSDISLLKKSSERLNCAIILMGMYRDRSQKKKIYNSSYSNEVIYACRSMLNVSRVPGEHLSYSIRHVKSNLASTAPDQIATVLSEEELQRLDEIREKEKREKRLAQIKMDREKWI